PPRLGPLATPDMGSADLGLRAGTVAPVTPAPPPPVPPVQAGPGAGLPLAEYPLERCARITASIARSRQKTEQILRDHDLDEARGEPLKTHWAAEIKGETEHGKTALLRAYDAAYVAQLEDERGPIAVEDYARIVVAAERGTANATLAALGLPEGSMLRIQRVWMQKIGKDPALRRLVRSSFERA